MELKLDKEQAILSEIIFDAGFSSGSPVEQSVEFDYSLPDYFPDIFKILKYSVKHGITSYKLAGDKLMFDGVAYIKVIYQPEKNNSDNNNDDSDNTKSSSSIRVIENHFTYSKTVELGRKIDDSDNISVSIIPKTQYVNARPINGRRIDVRAAVSAKIKISSHKNISLLVDISGAGIQTKKNPLKFVGDKLTASKQFVVRDEIATGNSDDGEISIISNSENVVVSEFKLLGDKIAVKGEANVKVLYISSKDNGPSSAENFEASIPISVIVDLPGVTENYSVHASLSVLDCDLKVKPSDVSETRVLGVDLTLNAKVSANLEKTADVVTDLYSTDFETSFSSDRLGVESIPFSVSEQLSLKSNFISDSNNENFSEIIDSTAEINNFAVKLIKPNSDDPDSTSTSKLLFSGQIKYLVSGKNLVASPIFIDKTEAFEASFNVPFSADNYIFDPDIQLRQVNASISDTHGKSLDLRAIVDFSGLLYKIEPFDSVSDVVVDVENPKLKDDEFFLKIYYAQAGEEIWNLAKKYNSCASNIISENELEPNTTTLTSPQSLLISL